MSILILNAGANLRDAYYTQDAFYNEMPINDLKWQNLERFNIIIIPSWSDRELLNRYKKQLIRFIEKGGILLSFGCHSMDWFPFLTWRNSKPREISCTEVGVDSGIFDRIDLNYLRWHPALIAHGHFQIKHGNTKILAIDNLDNPLMVTVESGKGIALFTTLDPDFHYITGSFAENNEDKSLNAAIKLLRQIKKWATDNFNQRHRTGQKIFRKLRGLLNFPTIAKVSNPVLFLIILISTIYVLVFDPSASQPTVLLSTIVGSFGLLVTIAQYFRK